MGRSKSRQAAVTNVEHVGVTFKQLLVVAAIVVGGLWGVLQLILDKERDSDRDVAALLKEAMQAQIEVLRTNSESQIKELRSLVTSTVEAQTRRSEALESLTESVASQVRQGELELKILSAHVHVEAAEAKLALAKALKSRRICRSSDGAAHAIWVYDSPDNLADSFVYIVGNSTRVNHTNPPRATAAQSIEEVQQHLRTALKYADEAKTAIGNAQSVLGRTGLTDKDETNPARAMIRKLSERMESLVTDANDAMRYLSALAMKL